MAIAAEGINVSVAKANQQEYCKCSGFSTWTNQRLNLLCRASASKFEGDNLPEFSSFYAKMMADKEIATITSLLEDKSDN